MIVVTGLAVAVLVVLWRVRRARRAEKLAGLTGAKPTFAVEPPMRRQHRASKDVL